MTAPLVFLDTETTGLSLHDDIWEFAGIRREPDGTETELHLFIEHDRKKCDQLPLSFREDHYARYRDHQAYTKAQAASAIAGLLRNGKPHIVGAVPNFDTERLAVLLRNYGGYEPTWHYHLIDVENLSAGYALRSARWLYDQSEGDGEQVERAEAMRQAALPPWKSDDLSRVLGVEPPGDGERHTAMGDARWAMRLYDRIVGGAA